MGRPRKAVWESADKAVYIKRHKGGYLVVDTRGEHRGVLRRSLDEALDIAHALEGVAPRQAEMTFFELAALYFEEGLPRWDKSRTTALTSNVIEDRKSRVRRLYAFAGSTPLSMVSSLAVICSSRRPSRTRAQAARSRRSSISASRSSSASPRARRPRRSRARASCSARRRTCRPNRREAKRIGRILAVTSTRWV